MQRCSRPRCPSFSLLFRTGKNIDNSSWSNSIAIAVVTPKCICTRSLPLFHAFACRFTYTVGLPLHPILYNFSPLPLSWNRSTKRACSFQAWLCACFPQQCLKRGSLWPGSWPCIFKVWASSPCGSVCYIVTWGNLFEQQKNLSDTKKDGVKWPFWIIFGLLVLWQLLQTVVILQIMASLVAYVASVAEVALGRSQGIHWWSRMTFAPHISSASSVYFPLCSFYARSLQRAKRRAGFCCASDRKEKTAAERGDFWSVNLTDHLSQRPGTLMVGLLLHGLHYGIPPPERYPDLWTLLFTGVSCGHLDESEWMICVPLAH